MANKKQRNYLLMSIIVFLIVAVIALYLVLNKGHIGNYALVNTNENDEEKLIQTIDVSVEKEYLSSNDEEETNIVVKLDGEEVTEGIEYASSNEDVIKIENGKAIAVNNGKATVTARVGEIADSADVHVITPIKSMSFTSTSKSIRVGKELQMKLQLKPSDASIDTLTYTSSDEAIATVNSNGIVTGVSKGTVTITVTDSYTGTEKSVTLIIR